MRFSFTQGAIIMVAAFALLVLGFTQHKPSHVLVPQPATRVGVPAPGFDGVDEKEVIAPTEDAKEVDISDWVEYRNEELGIQFRHPPEWEAEEFENEFHGVKEAIVKRDESTSFSYHEGPYYDVSVGDEEPVVIGGRVFTKYSQELTVEIPLSENTLLSFRSDMLTRDQVILDQILSTFEFIATTVTTGMGSLPILPPGGSGAATSLEVVTSCSETELRQGIALFEWKVADEPGTEQRVELTIFLDGFKRGDFEVSSFLSPDQSHFEWEELSGQANHFWRVSTRHPDGWIPSESSIFTGPTCVADFIGISG